MMRSLYLLVLKGEALIGLEEGLDDLDGWYAHGEIACAEPFVSYLLSISILLSMNFTSNWLISA
jgi:hypothetical protein